MTKRDYTIDFIKGLAILSVVLIHALSDEALYTIQAPYYIWQTVPVFMILIGYNSSNSFMRKEYQTLSEIFSQHYFSKKIKRILLPFTFIWLAQVLIQFIHYEYTTIPNLLISFFEGGYGPGSYFVPFIVQAAFLVPIIYIVLKKNPTKGMIFLFFVSLFADFTSYGVNISEDLYRVLIIRHLFSLTLGVWFSLVKTRLTIKWLIIPAIFSFSYITAVYYFDWEIIIEQYWRSQHAPSYFYVLLLVVTGVNYLNITKQSIFEKSFVLMGQASFHIFLTQMVYFWFVNKQFPDFNGTVYILISLVASTLSGISFYHLDNYLNKMISSNQ